MSLRDFNQFCLLFSTDIKSLQDYSLFRPWGDFSQIWQLATGIMSLRDFNQFCLLFSTDIISLQDFSLFRPWRDFSQIWQ
jgi:hypothetical protein